MRAETGVKSVKEIVSENCNVSGGLDTDSFSLALLQYRNTPCRYLNQSPAQILFARNLKDGVPCVPGALQLRPEWIKTKEDRERALARKHVAGGELWAWGTKEKNELSIGDVVAVQQKTGRQKNMWTLSGVVVDSDGPHSYWIKLDGSGCLSKRKRQHLKKISPFLEQLGTEICHQNEEN